MPLVPANQPQLIRSCQKDEFYQNNLTNNANELVHTFAGSRRWLQCRKEIELLSDLTYYVLTTLSGYQTLGEEYVSIIQVDPSERRIPSRMRRTALIFFHTFVPYLMDKVLICVENELEAEAPQNSQHQTSRAWNPLSHVRFWIQRAVGILTESQRKSLIPLVFALQQGITLLYRLHVAVFYISGAFYHIGKRAAGVTYLRVGNVSGDDPRISNGYRLLGALSLLQLGVTLTLQFNNLKQRQRARQEWKQHRNLLPSPQVSESSSRSSRCILCLEERRNTTCTPCGHLFCWECITEWCNTKTECPLCREKFQPHRLVYLRSYK
ncbi:peroxisome biogenesis factor 10 [Rhinichthys klamathensis goyatoka]|uniref:peroxisome biogenesis factor 10 n=1 Tax=Rhinichthys klamathensis goyatoka TaxID=3034132 RepID=UPI0024B6345C|nr:peroxisome biogenesis factor 10 [Rhinichthys klamathensis goyatoka]